MAFSTNNFSIEHIIPSALGGTDELHNLALACQGCNGCKYTKVEVPDPVSGQTVPLYHPRLDTWNEHFTWSEDFLSVLGLTSTGRATVAALHLNRQSVMNLRYALLKIGQHPPGN